MAKSNEKPTELQVTFVDLSEGEQAPRFAAYQLNSSGRPIKKLGSYDGQRLRLNLGDVRTVAFGPDVEEFGELPRENLIRYRVAQRLDIWNRLGVVLPRDVWDRFFFVFVCVSGTVNKCRPWFWDLFDDIRLGPMYRQAHIEHIKPINAGLLPHLFPVRCQTICDGIVEIYERECCCDHIHIPGLLDRLREILDILPIPIPDPIPDPIPGPFPGPFPGPIPGPDPAPFSPQLMRATVRKIQQRRTPLNLGEIPPENLYQDYLTLRQLPLDAARLYVHEHPYLFPIFCHCSVRKVGETAIEAGGHFDFCYRRRRHYHPHGNCVTTYAYKVKQMINGVWTVVYDGLAANQYFAAGAPADIRTSNPQARVCAEGPGDPPPNDGSEFVMLEYVGEGGTYHFNFPAQNGVSQVSILDADDGTYTTAYAPDCPWGGELRLRLWFSPALEPIVKYYRLKVVSVNDAGMPVGTPSPLNDPVTWQKLVRVSGSDIRVPETLGPFTIGSESDLFTVPYWNSPDHRYTSDQFHQSWHTNSGEFPDGKYLLIIEVFDATGNRIKPNGSVGPGTAQNFQFRRWTSTTDTDAIPFADAAHVFWVDNTPVGGMIADLRKNHVPNTAECQFMSDTADSTFGIGFKAYHVNGVEDTGLADANSFMWHYGISWQRGLHGATGTLGPAPSGGNNHTDVGEAGGPVESDTRTFADMLGGHSKCTFSVTLNVYAKHFTGSERISNFDYHETASFALAITGSGSGS